MIENVIERVTKARTILGNFVHVTPLDQSKTFSTLTGNEIFLKLENLQKTGSFKIRGALNKIAHLSENEKEAGVITSSAGNHGQGVALAASINGISSTVVIPEGTPLIKAQAIKGYGARVLIRGDNYDEAYKHAKKIQKEEGLTFIHAFNDEDVIIGQATIGMEILELLPDVDIIMVPIGGGGLISGIASYCKAKKPSIRIVGVEAAGAAAMHESIQKGKIVDLPEVDTIAEGIAVKKPGEITYGIIRELVDEIILVEEDEIANSILMLMERAKLMVEGAGSVALAAALNKLTVKNKKIVVVISGGNIDITLIQKIIVKGLIKAGRLFKFKTTLIDKPGSLMSLLRIIAD
ncbi:MAG: threonine ammonia-lyase, partial [Candidatus Helarchaeota archaeon]